MALIDWTEALSVKVTELDEQHKRLIGMINALNDAMKAGRGKEVLKTILDEMIEYTGLHFGTEEKYMDSFGYMQTFQHKQEHKSFVKKALDLQKGLAENRVMLSLETMNFLKDWLQKHIMGTDQKYSDLFNKSGLR